MFNSFTAAQNKSFDYRKGKFAQSATILLAGRLHCDIFLQRKLIIPNVSFSITLTPAKDAFRLFSNTTPKNEKLKIVSAVLRVRRVNLTASALLNLERQLTVRHAKYQLQRSVVRTAQVLTGQTELMNYVIHNGVVPRLALVTMTQSTNFQGRSRRRG